MNHPVYCSNCAKKFCRGVTRVRRCIVFHFCADCQTNQPEACDQIMEEVSKVTKAAAA